MNTLRRVLALLLATFILAACCTMLSGAVNDGKMAFNIYSDPVQTGGSGKYDCFSIDFCGIQTPRATYWALCNWGLDLSNSRTKYPNIHGGGAYAGLQNTGSRVGIMSFWDMPYTGPDGEEIIMRANRVYPKGAETSFGNEGEGNNWIDDYPWRDQQWYRMVLRTWEDSATGTTMVGQWFLDLSSGEWTLFSYFNTHLTKSAMTGAMSLFQENYSSYYAGAGEREFYAKNIYAHDLTYNKWLSWNTANMSCGATQTNKKGTRSFGSTNEYFWGKANGADLENQAAYNATAQVSGRYSITQPDQPSFGKPVIKSARLSGGSGDYVFKWQMNPTGTPALSYRLVIRDEQGRNLTYFAETRPEVNSVSFHTDAKAFYCDLTVTDIYGQTVNTVTDLVGKHTVTWDVGGKITTESYYDGETPVFKGSTAKAPDTGYVYTFTGWTPAIAPVSADVTYTATYRADKRSSLLGDINADGIVSIVDVTTLLTGLANGVSDAQTAIYDVSEDGIVNIVDVTVLLALLANL